ncbi:MULTISPECIES: AraC family transcriptional regulator [unclassified Streptomyces]|uniref:AraC family transcriptional regulator n=1 Tax=unclassified Streptomyces TaxID=2593676 RepID=UPI00081F3B4D|nr:MULTISPECIES: helix-turn-helix domain-containing protein [unclassified Streptomyces]MYR95955.1 helix-turn-helix domain-containing protein [Streptomyces sp. SID4937]SCE00288.1 Helix-turn-helix domain-containing protein [Streptomyces sp. ScaeMP-e83]
MAAGPRRDTRGIVDAPDLFTRVHFRRREPAPALRPYLEHYWLIDWDLDQPYAAHVVPHPSVNLVLQRYEAGESARERDGYAEVAGIGLGLFTQKLTGRGRVCGVQFRPGGFRPFAPEHALSDLTGRRIDAAEVLRTPPPVGAVLDPADEDARVAALDACLLALEPRPDPQAKLAMELVDRVRTDRSVRRTGQLARDAGLTPRSLQRLFSAYVGVGPKWVILRYRIHEALERAESDPAVDWARLAADLGYSDQAHLVRDFTATVGVPPTAFAAPQP